MTALTKKAYVIDATLLNFFNLYADDWLHDVAESCEGVAVAQQPTIPVGYTAYRIDPRYASHEVLANLTQTLDAALYWESILAEIIGE